MIITNQIIALLPIIILSGTIILLMLSVSFKRNNTFNAILANIGMLVALASCFYVALSQPPQMITKLFQADRFSLFHTGLVLISGIITVIFARPWLSTFPDNREEFYILLLLSVLGGASLSMSSHFISFIVGIELISLPLLGLIGYAFRRKLPLESATKYMILSSVTSTFMLFGIALIFAITGDLYFDTLGKDLSLYYNEPFLLLGMGLLVIGIGFKLSLAPFQLWTPDVFQGAPSPVSFYLATGAKVGIFAVIMRIFNVLPIINESALHVILILCAFCSIVFGNFVAILQSNIKRLLAYSSISHFGYLLIVLIALNTQEKATEALNIYFISYFLSSISVFGAICYLSSPYHGSDEDQSYKLKGLFWRSPSLSLSMTISLLSLAGIPLTIGFIGKFYIFELGASSQLWILLLVIILGSALGLFYYLRVAINLFLTQDRDIPPLPAWKNRLSISKGCIITCAILVILLGVYPRYLIDVASWAQIG